MLSPSIISILGIDVTKTEPVSGGDINQCYKLISPQQNYFLKLNHAKRFPHMFNREASGLKMLAAESSFKVPEVIKAGLDSEFQFLLLEWIDAGNRGRWAEAGRALAHMHAKPRDYFGFEENNFIGSLVQLNQRCNSWKDFFRDCRIMPFVKKLHPSLSMQEINNAEGLCEKTERVFPVEAPALLHGDLWSGNIMFCNEGPCIFDPAVYFGHREMDLGMTKLFGGFPEEFYHAYNEVYPLEKNWQSRLELTQLYPLLVHALLFGGHYLDSVKRILKKYS